MPRFKTNEKDFKRFKEFVREAIAAYKLKNWDLTFEHKYIKNNMAEIIPDLEEETAKIILSTDWEAELDDPEDDDNEIEQQPVTVKNLRETAWHEVEHLLLHPLQAMLDRYNADHDEVLHVIHVIIGKIDHARTYKRRKRKPK